MSKVLVNETSLTAIGNAIRDKNGKSDKYKPSEMAAAIGAIETGGGGDIEVEPIVLTGNCSYICSYGIASAYIELFGDTITTSGVTDTNYMFRGYKNTTIPFEINIDNSNYRSMANMFMYSHLKELPKINNAYPSAINNLFDQCYYLKAIPEDYMDAWNFNRIYSYSSASISYMFNDCYSLRSIPIKILSKLHNDKATLASYKFYSSAFSDCHVLDEIVGVPVDGATLTTNSFGGTFTNCNRIKNLIFETNEDGSTKIANWKTQTIDLTANVGYLSEYKTHEVLDYNSGITADKQVKDDATYQALKNDADWFAIHVAYSRYNHDSAVATINSLPDTSAYLAEKGGTNTIKFKGANGRNTDGGAINTLTEEEIAVAAAKGWTITLS